MTEPGLSEPGLPEPGLPESGLPEPRQLDATALAGLAHPLRLALLEALTVHGAATASDLARRLGESSGATSYHLRQLERHGFVEEDPSRGSRRERWWRVVRQNTRLRSDDFAGDPAMQEAQRLVVGEWQRGRERRYHHWMETRDAWPDQWRQASVTSTSHFGLTAAEAAQVSAELQEVVMRWAERIGDRDEDNAPEGTRSVEIHVDLFPGGEPPGREADGTERATR